MSEPESFFAKLLRESKFATQVTPEQAAVRKVGGYSPFRTTPQWAEIEQAVAHAKELKPQEAIAWTFTADDAARLGANPGLALKRLIWTTAHKLRMAEKVGRTRRYAFDWRVDEHENGQITFAMSGKSEVI